jgi:hypothetical protein
MNLKSKDYKEHCAVSVFDTDRCASSAALQLRITKGARAGRLYISALRAGLFEFSLAGMFSVRISLNTFTVNKSSL